MNTTDTITASRERIESDLMESEPIKRVLAIENLAIVTGRAREYHGKTIQEVLSQALLQHEAVVREEMEKQFRKFQFRYIITGDEIKYCGDPERLSQRKEYLERDLFRQLGDKIRKDGAFTKGFPKAPTDDDIMGEITVIVKMPSKVPRTTQPTI